MVVDRLKIFLIYGNRRNFRNILVEFVTSVAESELNLVALFATPLNFPLFPQFSKSIPIPILIYLIHLHT